MTKQYVGTTLIYDLGAETYLRTEIYESGDPGATIELRIIEPQSEKTPKTITRGERQQPLGSDPDPEPFLLRAEHRKTDSEPPQHPTAGEGRRQTRVLPSQRAKHTTSGRPKMVATGRGDDDQSEPNMPPPFADRTLDGVPFVQHKDD